MEIKPNIRYTSQIKDVLFDKNYQTEDELYYMFRGVENKGNLRYDITEIPARMLGKEYVKTKGHYHVDFQEIYIILEGEAIFLLQKGFDKIEDAYFVRAKKNNVVLIPYNYGHISINPTKENLKMANWVSNDAGHDYDSIAKKSGACYFYTTDGFIKNNNYDHIPEIREEKPLSKLPENIEEICKRKS